MDRRLKQQIAFILEADKLKNVIRRNYLVDDSRRRILPNIHGIPL